MHQNIDSQIEKYRKLLPINSFEYISKNKTIPQNVVLYAPNIALSLSIFLGCLGLDRFYIQDYIIGIVKLVTGGGCGLWWLIDIFIIKRATKQRNLHYVLKAIQ